MVPGRMDPVREWQSRQHLLTKVDETPFTTSTNTAPKFQTERHRAGMGMQNQMLRGKGEASKWILNEWIATAIPDIATARATGSMRYEDRAP